MMLYKLPYFATIFTLSVVSNLLIPYAIYLKKFGFDQKRDKDFISVNAWGIIMDGALAGLINITALNFLLEVKQPIFLKDLGIALTLGIAVSVFTHILMAQRRWRIWIMPHPWRWNEAGYWHMVSMTIQISFLSYPLIILTKDISILQNPITQISLILTLFWTSLFLLALYYYDNKKELKIGKIKIGNTSW